MIKIQKAKPRFDNWTKRIAFHEAGHAVMLINSHLQFTDFTLQSEKGVESRMDLKNPLENWLYVMVMLAGRIAEEKLCTGKSTPRYTDDIEQDFHKAATAVRSVCHSPEESKFYFEWCRVRAANILKMHQEAVKRIAFRLLIKQSVTYKEVLKIVKTAPKQNQIRKLISEWKKVFISEFSGEVESIPCHVWRVRADSKKSADFNGISDQAAPVSAC